MPVLLDEPTLAYLAGVLDYEGVIRVRELPTGTQIPYVGLSGSNAPMLALFAKHTGTRSVVTRRKYVKAGCNEHCKEKHVHVQSVSGRWSVTGAKATVLLWNVQPYVRFQTGVLSEALAVGLRAPFKNATVEKMRELGWDVPNARKLKLIEAN